MGGDRGALDACDHRDRVDRIFVLFHRVGSWACTATAIWRAGADGEEWQVHGGGFYHVQKYLVAPEAMPDHLIWFKWESYATWLSGFFMLVLVYYMGAELYLIDPTVMELTVWQAVGDFDWVAGLWLGGL